MEPIRRSLVPTPRPSRDRQRLRALIDRTDADLARRMLSDRPLPEGHQLPTRALLDAAMTAFDAGEDERAWELVLDARRGLVAFMDSGEEHALCVSLRAQAAKVDTWRKQAVTDLLADGPDGGPPPLTSLVEAMRHLDEFDANQKRIEHSRRDELRAAAGVLLVALALLPMVLAAGADLDATDVSFANLKLVLLVELFGVLGACVSAIERTTKRRPKRVPDERAARLATFVRLATGASAGLLALAAGQAGIIGDEPGAVLIASFAAGLSERYVLGLLPSPPTANEGSR